MENKLIEFIYIGIAINFWTHYFGPMQTYRFQLTNYLSNLICRKQWFYLSPILTLLNCSKCLGFWLGSLIYWSVPMGMIMSVYAYILDAILRGMGNTHVDYRGDKGGDSK